MKILKKDPTKSLIKLVYALLVTVIIIFALPKVISCILPFALAWIVSLIIKPLSCLLERAHIQRRIAVIISMLLVVGILALVIYGLSSVLVSELKTVADMFKDTKDGLPVFVWDMIDTLPKAVRGYAVRFADALGKDTAGILMPAIKSAVSKIGGAAGKVPGAIVFTIVFILAVYFISYDSNGFKKELKRFIPSDKLLYIKSAKDSFSKACGGYIKAQLIIMCVVFCILLAGFIILDIGTAFLLALIIGFLDAIPVLGTGIILNPWAVVCLISGDYARAIGLFAIYGVVFLTRQFLEPRVLSGQLGIHPLVTLMSMYIGLKLIGIIGMILGPVAAIIVINLINANKSEEKEAAKNEC